jgi:nucleoside-diphosphate-sugar epimerase
VNQALQDKGKMEVDDALRVAITGANGNLGRKLIAAFLKAPEIAAIRALDRDVTGLAAFDCSRLVPVKVDLRGPALTDVLAGMNAVVHLAAQNPYPDASWEDASASFDMTARLVEASARAGLRRFVFASSNHVMGGYKDTPVAQSVGGLSTRLPPLVGTRVKTSEGLMDSTAYAAAKLMGERLVAAKAAAGAFSAVSLRIGWCQPGENSPETLSGAGTPKSGSVGADPEREPDLRWFKAMWLSNRDLVRCVSAALHADASRWPSPAVVVNAVSANRPSPWDLSAGRKLIGYHPLDNVSTYAQPRHSR